MQTFKKYKINDLVDKSKKIKIINFYDNSIMFEGYYNNIPKIFFRWDYIVDIKNNYYIFTLV